VLHEGRVLAQGPVAAVVAATGASEIRSAFASLTQMDADEAGAMA
jgi:hypothetical protein